MPRMVDRSTGREVDVAEDEVAKAYRSGAFDPVEGETYNVLNSAGKRVAVGGDALGDVVRAGFGVESAGQRVGRLEQEALEEHANTIGNRVAAPVLGALRGLTGGLSDVALRASGGDARELAAIRDFNPLSSFVGEVGGSLLGGVGAFRATPAGLINRAGSAAGARVGAALGRGGSSLLARAAQRAIPLATQTAVEGTLFGAGQGLSQVMLSDEPLTAEALVSTIGSSALYGGLASGGAGLAGAGIAAGTKALARSARKQGAKLLAKGAPAVAPKSAEAAAMRGVVREQLEHLSTSAATVRTAADDVLRGVTGAADDVVEGGQQLGAQLSGNQRQAIEAAVKRVDDAKVAFDDLVKPKQKSFDFAAPDVDDVLKRKPEEFRKVFDASAELQQATEDLVKKTRPHFGGDLPQNLDEALSAMPGMQGDKAAKFNALDLAAAADLAGFDTDQIPVVGAAASTLLKAYAAGRAFQVARSGSAREAVSKLLQKSVIVPKAGVGRIAAETLGNAGKVTGSVLTKVDRALGAFLKAGPAAAKVAAPASAGILGRVRFSEDSKQVKPRGRSQQRQASLYHQRARELSDSVANLQALESSLRERLQGLSRVSPGLLDQSVATSVRALQFLHDKMPKAAMVGSPFGKSAADKYVPSSTDLAKWSRYVAAVDNPASVLDDLKAGRVTAEGVEALKAVYPTLYARIQQGIVERLGDLNRELPYSKRVQLSQLFGVPVDATMQPAFIAAMQANFQSEQSQKPQGPQGSPSFGRISPPAPTPAQRVTDR